MNEKLKEIQPKTPESEAALEDPVTSLWQKNQGDLEIYFRDEHTFKKEIDALIEAAIDALPKDKIGDRTVTTGLMWEELRKKAGASKETSAREMISEAVKERTTERQAETKVTAPEEESVQLEREIARLQNEMRYNPGLQIVNTERIRGLRERIRQANAQIDIKTAIAREEEYKNKVIGLLEKKDALERRLQRLERLSGQAKQTPQAQADIERARAELEAINREIEQAERERDFHPTVKVSHPIAVRPGGSIAYRSGPMAQYYERPYYRGRGVPPALEKPSQYAIPPPRQIELQPPPDSVEPKEALPKAADVPRLPEVPPPARPPAILPERPGEFKKDIKITFVDMDELFRQREEKAAREALNAEFLKRQGSVIGRAFGKIGEFFKSPRKSWEKTGNYFKRLRKRGVGLHILEEYHLARYQDRARRAFRESGNFFSESVDLAGDAAFDVNARIVEMHAESAAVVERFSRAGRYIEKEAGEKEARSLKNRELNSRVSQLIKDYAISGDAAALDNGCEKILERVKELEGINKKEKILAANLKEIITESAREMKAVYGEHAERIQGVNLDIDLQFGRAVSAIAERTKDSFGEKVVRKLQRNPVTGTATSPGPWGLAASIISVAGVRAVARTAGLLAHVVAPIVGGGIAGFIVGRERGGKEHEDLVLLGAERKAVGEKVHPEGKLAQKIERLQFDMSLWDDLARDLKHYQRGIKDDGELQAAVQTIAEVEARLRRGRIDEAQLRRFSNANSVERSRLELRLALQQAVEAGEAYLRNNSRSEQIDALIHNRIDSRSKALEAGISEKRKERKKEKRKARLEAGLKASGWGIVGGAVAMEAFKLASDIGIPGFGYFKAKDTALRAAWRGIRGATSGPPGGEQLVGAAIGGGEAWATQGGAEFKGAVDFSTRDYQGIFQKDGKEFIEDSLKGSVKDLPGLSLHTWRLPKADLKKF